jgi:hypothetical protein
VGLSPRLSLEGSRSLHASMSRNCRAQSFLEVVLWPRWNLLMIVGLERRAAYRADDIVCRERLPTAVQLRSLGLDGPSAGRAVRGCEAWLSASSRCDERDLVEKPPGVKPSWLTADYSHGCSDKDEDRAWRPRAASGGPGRSSCMSLAHGGRRAYWLVRRAVGANCPTL